MFRLKRTHVLTKRCGGFDQNMRTFSGTRRDALFIGLSEVCFFSSGNGKKSLF